MQHISSSSPKNRITLSSLNFIKAISRGSLTFVQRIDSLSATRPTPPTLSDAGWYTRPVAGSMLMAEGTKGDVKKRPPWLNDSSGSEESLKCDDIKFESSVLVSAARYSIRTQNQEALHNVALLTHQVRSWRRSGCHPPQSSRSWTPPGMEIWRERQRHTSRRARWFLVFERNSGEIEVPGSRGHVGTLIHNS